MLRLINDLLDVSAIEAGKLTLKREEVNLHQYLEEVRASNAILAKEKSIALGLEIRSPLPGIVFDRSRIVQVLNNLITNAIKFSHRETSIILSATADDHEIVISVADQGQGIPAEEMCNLFSDFTKTSVRPTGGEKSHGLGLAIVKRIVEAHAGRIWVESDVGKGSTFFFSLPRQATVSEARPFGI
ncbi:sensor histidine kinase [Candidatus Sumerlaeota bacterium]